MFAVSLTIRPTSALTFRILPGSILDIATYPFVPPTTLSGWLRRLFWAKEGILPPDLREGNSPRFYVLPRSYLPLGAYPQGGWRVHRTYRHGPREFSHSEFSKLLRRDKKGGDLQLHTWEYLLVETLVGAVLSEDRKALEGLKVLEGFGSKLGKEGFAYLEQVGEPVEVAVKREDGVCPITPVRLEGWRGSFQGVYPLYRFVHKKGNDPSPESPDPSPVEGYEVAYFLLPDGPAGAEGFRLGEWFFAWDLVEFLRG